MLVIRHLAGSLFTAALSADDSPDSIAEFAIYSELASGGHDPKWYSDLGDQCHDDYSCTHILKGVLRGAQTKTTLDQAIKALQKAGYLNSTFSSKSPTEVVATAIREFQKTQGFVNAKSWYRGTVALLKFGKDGFVTKPTYLEKLVEQ